MKNWKIILLAVACVALVIIFGLLSQNLYLKKQNELLLVSLNRISSQVGVLETQMTPRAVPSVMKPKAATLRKAAPCFKPEAKTAVPKGNRGFLTRDGRSTYGE
ncbi:MAG: hypothetical protein WC321_02250 [Candidatus Omnitrophota bacterium]|jgi:hypothetical protein